MRVKNNAARLFILGDHNNSSRRKGTKLMPGAVTDVGDDPITIKCVKRAIEKGKPLEILDAPKPKSKKTEKVEKKSEEKSENFGGFGGLKS